MKILIMEDEPLASEHLKRLLCDLEQPTPHITSVQSVTDAIEVLNKEETPDIVFSDIHLADGLAFRVFEQVKLTSALIFTTAYDQYALDAFQAGGIDYLLKPIDRTKLEQALVRARRMMPPSPDSLATVGQALQHYHSHFLFPVLDRLVPVDADQMACLYLEDKLTHIVMMDGSSLVIDSSLDSLMTQLNPKLFYRANRQYIIAHSAIREVALWPLYRLAIKLSVASIPPIIISKSKVSEFKKWYTQ